MTNYLDLTIKELHELLKKKEIKPIDLVEEAFTKIEKDHYNAFITLNYEEAKRQALELEKEEVNGLLFGIPVAVKDNIVTKNLRTTCASHMLDDFTPVYDATVVEKLKREKAIIIGKTNMDEFAMGSTGETSYFKASINPWNKDKVTGGSSSGSAVSVSSREVSVALGSDTGGSIRQPSSFCGLVGLKPTYGRVSRYGLIAFASSLDQIGPMTKTVEDNAIVLSCIAGRDEKDLTSGHEDVPNYLEALGKDIKGMKIAVPHYYMSDAIHSNVKAKVEEMIRIIKEAGASVDYVEIPYIENAIALYQIIALGEASSNLARFDGIRYGHLTENYNSIEQLYENTRSEGFGNEVKRRIMIGSYILSGENADKYYTKALKVRRALTDSFKKVFETYDLIIGPTNTDVAYSVGTKVDDALKSFYDDILTIPVNMAGLPGLSLPIGFNTENLPIGMHIIGSYYKEETIYTLASFLEKKLSLNLNPTTREEELC